MRLFIEFNAKRNQQKYIRSPPAWTQEAYCLPCSEYSFCCPNWVPLSWPGGTLLGGVTWGYPTWVPPVLTWWGGTLLGVPYLGAPPSWPGRGATLLGGTLPGYLPVLTWQGGYPAGGCTLPGYPPSWLGRVHPQCLPHGILGNVAKHYGIQVPPCVCPMAFWVMLQSIMGYGYPPVDRQTDTCQNITFPVVLRTRAVKISNPLF